MKGNEDFVQSITSHRGSVRGGECVMVYWKRLQWQDPVYVAVSGGAGVAVRVINGGEVGVDI